MLKSSTGKRKYLIVKVADGAAQPSAGSESDDHTPRADEERPLHVVPAECRVAVPERLEGGDLRALQRERARERHVQDERRHHQEDERQQQADALELRELVLEHPVRELQRARDCAEPAVGLEQAIQLRNRLLGGRIVAERQRDVVEAAFNVERGGERLVLHPEDPEPPVIRHQLAGADAVDILRRERHADNGEAPEPPVDDRRHDAPRRQAVRRDESLAGKDFVGAAAFDPPAAAEKEVVDRGASIGGDRDEPARRRRVELLQGKGHVRDDAGFEGRDAGDGGDVARDPLRRTFQRGKHVGEPLPFVVGALRLPQRREIREVHDIHGDAGCHHHRDGERLSPHRQEVAQQLPVQRGDRHPFTTTARAPRASSLYAPRWW